MALEREKLEKEFEVVAGHQRACIENERLLNDQDLEIDALKHSFAREREAFTLEREASEDRIQ